MNKQDKITEALAAIHAAGLAEEAEQKLRSKASELGAEARRQQNAADETVRSLVASMIEDVLAEDGYAPGRNVVHEGTVYTIEGAGANITFYPEKHGSCRIMEAVNTTGKVYASAYLNVTTALLRSTQVEMISQIAFSAPGLDLSLVGEGKRYATSTKAPTLTDLPNGYRMPTLAELRGVLRKAGLSTDKINRMDDERKLRYSFARVRNNDNTKLSATQSLVHKLVYRQPATTELAEIVRHKAVSEALQKILTQKGWLESFEYTQQENPGCLPSYITTMAFKLSSIDRLP